VTTQSARPAPSGAFEFLTTKKDEFVGWARKFSLFPYPFVTACCAMEFMSVSSTLYDTDRFGAALPRFTPRQSDLLMVVGTVTCRRCSNSASRASRPSRAPWSTTCTTSAISRKASTRPWTTAPMAEVREWC